VIPFFTEAGAPVFNSVNNAPDTVAATNPGLTGFSGLDAATSQRLNGFPLEPPDQGLCTDGTSVMEVINLAWAVYTTHGTVVAGPQDANSFFGEEPSVFTSDPRCYYDVPTGRWFLTILATDFGTGNSFSRADIAVSQTSNPAGPYYLYRVDDTFSGQGGCPCFGDQPLLGADANGFYVSVNAFTFTGKGSYKGASIYAMSKRALESGTMPAVVQVRPPQSISTPSNPRNSSLQPAQSPTGDFQPAAGGTEYFLSTSSFSATNTQHVLMAWALSGTESLDGASPALTLSSVSVPSETYGPPPGMQQEPGPLPQGNSLGFTSPAIIQTDDNRMNQVAYVGGQLWGAVNTAVNGQPGIGWFVVGASGGGASFAASMINQGFLTGAGSLGLSYPSIGVNSSGAAVMAFDASGPANFPSVGYVTLTATGAPGPIHIAAAGPLPYDGFSCYLTKHQGGPCRWGDYTAAAVAPDGSVWFAGELTTTTTDSAQNNWGTFIGHVTA
jgi:hypothetical protein